jgi:hypothetical protein
MEKYGKPYSIRPKNFFPRLDIITVYALTVERMTGKQRLLPPLSEQWPAKDQTRTPHSGLIDNGFLSNVAGMAPFGDGAALATAPRSSSCTTEPRPHSA